MVIHGWKFKYLFFMVYTILLVKYLNYKFIALDIKLDIKQQSINQNIEIKNNKVNNILHVEMFFVPYIFPYETFMKSKP